MPHQTSRRGGWSRQAKKRIGSVGRPPTEPEDTERACSTRSAGHPHCTGGTFHYHEDAPVVRRRRNNVYCYLTHKGAVNNIAVSAFVDNGASFNAVDPRVIEQLGLKVTDCPTPLHITVGNNQRGIIPRRVTKFQVQLEGFPVYETEAFVMSISESRHILLGMPWLEEVNPEVDWTTKSIRDRASGASATFHQCIRTSVARQAGGRRIRAAASRAPGVSTLEEVLLFYSKHAHCSALGDTKVISLKQQRKMKPEDGEFCFFVNAPTEKATRQLATD